MAVNLNTFGDALKILYPQKYVSEVTYKDNPFWGMVKKEDGFYGELMQFPTRFADPQARSRSFTQALGSRSSAASKLVKWQVYRGHDYASLQIDRETILASSNNAGAFLKARQTEVDAMLNELGRSIAKSLFADGSGRLVGISSNVTLSSVNVNVGSATFSVSEVNDLTNLEVGMLLVPADAGVPASVVTGYVGDSAGTGLSTLEITAINRTAASNQVTVIVRGANAPSTTVTAPKIFIAAGDNAALSAATYPVIGLNGWVPATAPAAGSSFFGVDRSKDATRLGGLRYDARGMQIREGLFRAASLIAREGGKPDTIIMNFNQFANLVTELQANVQYTEAKSTASIGYKAVSLIGPRGEMKIVPDMNCPNGLAYMLQLDSWCFHHLEGAPHIVTLGNSNGVLQEAAADAIQIRAALFGQLVCEAPGYNMVINLDS